MSSQCKHGQLARSCELCEALAEVVRLRRLVNRQTDEYLSLSNEAARLDERLESALGQNARLIEENKRLRASLSAGWGEK